MPLQSDSLQAYLNELLKLVRKLPTTSGGGGGGDASAANQVIGNNSLASIDTKTPTVGQKTMAASSPVVIASDQGDIPSDQKIWNGSAWVNSPGTTADGQYVTQIDKTATGNITTQNLVPAGTATAGSSVAINNANGSSTLTIQVTGTWTATGGLSIQGTLDNATWVTFNGAGTGVHDWSNSNSAGSTIGSGTNGIYSLNIAGVTSIRVTALGAVTGTAVIRLDISNGASSVSLNGNGGVSIGNINTVTLLTGTTTLTPGTAAANLGKAEDAVHSTGDTGVACLFLRNDTLTANTNASGDYILPTTDTYGAQYTRNIFTAKRTYSTSFSVALAATPSDVFQIIGSATTSVQITKIIVSGSAGTAINTPLILSKRSTANTGGTSTGSTMIPHTSGDAAATAVGSIYTVNPTSGTPVGNIRYGNLFLATSTGQSQIVEYNFAEKGKPIVLTGVAQTLCINLNSTAISTGTLNVSIEFTEE